MTLPSNVRLVCVKHFVILKTAVPEETDAIKTCNKSPHISLSLLLILALVTLPCSQVKVLHNQLVLFHNAIAAYFAGNQKQLEQTLKQFHIKLKTPGVDAPSWLEEQ